MFTRSCRPTLHRDSVQQIRRRACAQMKQDGHISARYARPMVQHDSHRAHHTRPYTPTPNTHRTFVAKSEVYTKKKTCTQRDSRLPDAVSRGAAARAALECLQTSRGRAGGKVFCRWDSTKKMTRLLKIQIRFDFQSFCTENLTILVVKTRAQGQVKRNESKKAHDTQYGELSVNPYTWW